MRLNEKELLSVASQIADKEGRMNYKAPGFREVYKERWFKIKGNLLFYFKLNEYGGICDKEAAGLLVVEHCSIQQDNSADLPFVFTIVFNDDKEKKHTFSCPTEKHCSEWVKHLKESSYEHQRAKLFLVQAKILKITGKDPLAAFPTRKKDQNGSGLQRSMSKTYSDPQLQSLSYIKY